MDFRTRVRFPPGPLKDEEENPCTIIVRDGFILFYRFDRVELQECFGAPVSYEKIREWIREEYGVHVSNINISQTKTALGLSKMPYKGKKAKEGYYVPKLKPEKFEVILKAFEYFGMM